MGTRLPLRSGDKIDPASGQSIDSTAEIIALKRDSWQSFDPAQTPLGDCAAIRIADVEVVLIERRTWPLDKETMPGLIF